jgi:uncharacterized protein YlxW (UPF0749 family)
VLLGILISVQFNTQKSAGFPLYNQRADLLKLVQNLESERNRLQADLKDTRTRLEKFEESAAKGEGLLKTMQMQTRQAREEAGLTPMKGPGIEIVLRDSMRRPAEGEDPYFYMVHDVDLQALVNELWASGSEAVSVNEQRIACRTSIRCAGPTILVSSERVVPPYVVKAIGPAQDMEAALRIPGGFLTSMLPAIEKGVQIRITSAQELTIPEFKGSLIFRYAKPVKG